MKPTTTTTGGTPKIDPLLARALAAGLRGLADDVRSGALDPRALLGHPLLPSAPPPVAARPRPGAR